VAALTAGQTQASPYDRVAYFDAAYGAAWAAGATTTVRDACLQAGYRVVTAAELKTWMDARIADKRLSVVVMCQDVVPTTVAETMTATCTIRRYLDAGGKVVWYADWPFYYCGTTGTTWGSNGAVQVLGFNASSGPNDQNQLVTITELGRRWGLTTPWSSTRPTSPTITPNLEVLARDNNGNAAGWVKHYVVGDTFRGFVRIEDHSGAPVNIPQLMAVAEYYEAVAIAVAPVPADGATDVPRDATVNWTAGQYPATHDVYFGATFADVNTASRTNPKAMLVSQGQTATTFDPPGVFAYGQTYYWRIDEVNTTPDNTIFKGGVWSFTVEPYGYTVKPVSATASSAQTNMGPEKTIDGSGLTSDLHGTDGTTMWLSTGVQPNWIQYQFDRVYKLYDLKVWNSNGLVESFIGFGAQSVTIETSTDGTTWTALANVPEFARAAGMAGYAANTTVNLGGVMAKYVKLTIDSTWGGVSAVTGLAEVRFSYVPAQAREPQPATAATGVRVDTSLNWRPGREAGSHQVFFGTDPNAVANGTASAKTVAEHAFTPGSLQFGTTYYWKVDEVNAVTYPGEVWSFTTQEYAAVDDFESYNDDDNRIYDAWIDGYTDGNSDSIVGNMTAPFAEQMIIHGGKQSMPFEYNNVKPPYYSEASRTFDTIQNWTGNGADTLVLYFQGRAPSFLETTPGNYLVGAGGTDIWNSADQFRFVYKSLTGNGTLVAKVDSIVVTDPWAKGGVMIRESLAAGSKFAAVYATPGNGVRYQARATADTAATSDTAVVTTEQTVLTIPVWVKIERVGNNFNGYYSADGVKWTAMSWNPQTITMAAATVYLGLAVTSHNAAAVTSAGFSNVATTGNATGSWQPQAIGITQTSNTPGPLYVMVQDSSGKSKVVNHPDPLATTLPSWQPWRIPLSQFTAAGVKVTSVKKLVIGVGDRTSPKANGAGMLYLDDIGFGHSIK
jgi:hypothetical protein